MSVFESRWVHKKGWIVSTKGLLPSRLRCSESIHSLVQTVTRGDVRDRRPFDSAIDPLETW